MGSVGAIILFVIILIVRFRNEAKMSAAPQQDGSGDVIDNDTPLYQDIDRADNLSQNSTDSTLGYFTYESGNVDVHVEDKVEQVCEDVDEQNLLSLRDAIIYQTILENKYSQRIENLEL